MLELYKYLFELIDKVNPNASKDVVTAVIILLSLAIMFLGGFGLSKLTKLCRLPNVTAYILTGVLIGPILGLIPGTGATYRDEPFDIISKMSFLSDLALGFIAFGVGKFFKKQVLLKAGWRVVVITVFEALLAGILVTVVVGIVGSAFPKLNINWSFALLLGAIATATAPASTMMTINQYKAKGDFVDTLLQVVALDDIVCLVVFSIALGVSNGLSNGSIDVWGDIFYPLLLNLAFIVVGFGAGFLLGILKKKRSSNSQLIITIALICLIAGAGALLNVSPLLSCMVFGAVYINTTQDEKIFKYMDHFTPPIMLLFFVRSGMNMNFKAFATVGVIGIIYFVVRIIGKYFGSYFGCKIVKKEKKTTKYLGFALIPQAGVALGLAELGRRSLSASGTPEATALAVTFSSIIICSSILYEMAGPILAKIALIKSGSISPEMLENPAVSKKEITNNEHIYSKVHVSDIEKTEEPSIDNEEKYLIKPEYLNSDEEVDNSQNHIDNNGKDE